MTAKTEAQQPAGRRSPWGPPPPGPQLPGPRGSLAGSVLLPDGAGAVCVLVTSDGKLRILVYGDMPFAD